MTNPLPPTQPTTFDWDKRPVYCDACGEGYVMLARHCKLVCPHCGFTRDCSDP